jgi:hypothetical protein
MIAFNRFRFVVTVMFAHVLILAHGTCRLSAAEEEHSKGKPTIVTASSWKEFQGRLYETHKIHGYVFSTWDYLGFDVEYQYAVNSGSTIIRVRKSLTPPNELRQAVRTQCQRTKEFMDLGDLDLPWTSGWQLDSFYRWREGARLDTSVLDRAKESVNRAGMRKEKQSRVRSAHHAEVPLMCRYGVRECTPTAGARSAPYGY